jgi:hypothetical protein
MRISDANDLMSISSVGIVINGRRTMKGRWVRGGGMVVLAFLGSLGCKQDEKPRKATVETIVAARRSPSTPASATTATTSRTAPTRAGEAAKVASEPKCDDICKLSAPLGCRNARECKPHCESMASVPVCAAEVKSLFRCLALQPTNNWECDEDGIGAIRDPFCSKEQSQLASCFESNIAR